MDLYTESIRHLPLGERLGLIQTIWDDIVSNDEQIPVPNSAFEEAKRRRDEMLVDPAVGLTHDEVWKKNQRCQTVNTRFDTIPFFIRM